MNLQDVSHIHIPDGDVRMIHDSDNRLLWGAVGYNVLFSGNTFQQSYTGKNLWGGFLSDFSRTSQGVSYTNKADGVILANGTSSGLAFSLLSAEAISSGRIITLQAGNYVLSGGSSTVSLQVISSSGGQIAETASNGVKAFTLSGATDIFVRAKMVSGAVANNVTIKPMLEAGSTATSYEPYVGGQPSPNPDYPQQIQTVTGQQTVTVTGKNLCGIPDQTFTFQGVTVTIKDGEVTMNGTSTGTGAKNIPFIKSTVLDGNYTTNLIYVSGTESSSNPSANINLRRTSDHTIVNGTQADIKEGNVYRAYSVSGEIVELGFYIPPAGVVFNNLKFKVQIVAGSTADYDFEPYSSTDYPIDLGSIELCKLGSYQDYIWKDGENWKVHKATVSAIIDGSENWSTSGANTFYVANIYSKIGNSIQSTSTGEMYASHFTIVDISSKNTLVGASLKVDAAHNLSNLRIRLQDMSGSTAGFRQMLSAKKPSIYARRLTPTDTTITDTNLIAQLEAIYNLVRRYGYNFVVSASGNNLPIIIDRTLL